MPDQIVTLNGGLVGVFKSGENVYSFFAQKNKNKIAIKLNGKLKKIIIIWGGGNNNLKQYYTYCFYA